MTIDKKTLFSSFILFSLILSLSFASAFSFSNLYGKITGKAITDCGYDNPLDCANPPVCVLDSECGSGFSCVSGHCQVVKVTTTTSTPVADKVAVGVLDSVYSDGLVGGWARDPDYQAAGQSIDVHFYIDGIYAGKITANQASDSAVGGNGNHRFYWNIPDKYYDGKNHEVWGYAIGRTSKGILSNNNPQLGSPSYQSRVFTFSTKTVATTNAVPSSTASSTTTAATSTQAAVTTQQESCVVDSQCGTGMICMSGLCQSTSPAANTASTTASASASATTTTTASQNNQSSTTTAATSTQAAVTTQQESCVVDSQCGTGMICMSGLCQSTSPAANTQASTTSTTTVQSTTESQSETVTAVAAEATSTTQPCGYDNPLDCANPPVCVLDSECGSGFSCVSGYCKAESICSEVYSPVCGNDGNTYPNQCTAQAAGIESFTKGVCKSEFVCNQGCSVEGKCYPIGYRDSENYCTNSFIFITQKSVDSLCNNGFECSSNICVSNKCIDAGAWDKFIYWINNLF